MVKYSNESNFFGLPQRMGSIGKSRSINQMKKKTIQKLRPGVHHHWRPGADVGTLGCKRKTVARQNVERSPTLPGRCIPGGISYLDCVVRRI